MSFDANNLEVWFANWPEIPAALWRYAVPDGDTIDDVLSPGYFDAATARLVPGSVIFVARPDMDGDGMAETVMLTVMSRKPAVADPRKPNRTSKVAAAARAVKKETSK